MPKRSGKSDDAQNSLRVIEELIEAPLASGTKEKDPLAVALGARGGRKGGKARAEKLTPKQLSEIGKLGASARWKDKKPK
jgi:hypothetical protein